MVWNALSSFLRRCYSYCCHRHCHSLLIGQLCRISLARTLLLAQWPLCTPQSHYCIACRVAIAVVYSYSIIATCCCCCSSLLAPVEMLTYRYCIGYSKLASQPQVRAKVPVSAWHIAKLRIYRRDLSSPKLNLNFTHTTSHLLPSWFAAEVGQNPSTLSKHSSI